MTDRENAIKGLEHCKIGDCVGCPYDQTKEESLHGKHNKWELVCNEKLTEDILALLKEQEAVEPTFEQGEDGVFVWACGSCGAYMYHIYDGIDKAKEYVKYCRQCGKKVKWE